MEIIWKGNQYTNKSSRRGRIPKMITNHITEGTDKSCISWFTSSGNKVSSAHFLVARDGKIYQFVKIEDNAWGNGLSRSQFKNSTLEIVRRENVNPNWYSVSIEHEGISRFTKGALTDKQYQATLWLHDYIRKYVKKKWGHDIAISRKVITGHFEVDPVRKPNCPGREFPFDKLISDLKNGALQSGRFKDVPKGHWAYPYVEKCVKSGILNGYTDGTFKPNKSVSRAEIAKIICSVLDNK